MLEDSDRIRERMELLSAASFEGLFFHIDGVVIDVNQRLAEMFGYAPHELLGPNTMQMCVAPEDIPGVLKTMNSGSELAYVINAVRKDGSRFRAELQAKQGKLGDKPLRVVAVRDITERERTQTLLRENEARLRELAQATFDVIVFNREGAIVEVGGEVEKVLGYTPEQMVGKRVLDFVAQAATPAITQVLEESGWACTRRW
jgi:PAS domain S-box-containing protein